MQISDCYMQNVYCMLLSLVACMFPVTCCDLGCIPCMSHACNEHVAIQEHACEIHALYMHWPCTVHALAMHCTCVGHVL